MDGFSEVMLLDWLLMIMATCLSLLHGAVLPVAMLVFGQLTNAFVNQYTSAQLANYEFYFDPVEYIELGRFAAIDFNVIITGFINFTNITGGVVNCSDDYELLPFNQTFDDILKLGVTQLASCLDNPTFLALVTEYTIIFIGLAIASWMVGGAHVTLFSMTSNRQVKRLRNHLFSSLMKQEIGWYDATPPGDITSQLTQDVDKVKDGLGEKLGILIQWMSTLVVGVIVSMVTEWRLTLLMAFAGLLIAMSTALLTMVTAFTTSHTLSLSATASAIAEEAMVAIATVKAFCAEDEECKRYSNVLKPVRCYGILVGVVSAISLGVVQLLVFSCYAASFWLGAYLVQEEIIQAGQFVTVFFAVLLVGVSIGQALPHVQRLVVAETAIRRLNIIISRTPLINNPSNHGNKEVWSGLDLEPSVQFLNVSFSYPTRPNIPVLKNVSFNITPGQTVAIVGATGSGKSTIGNLLTRLYDITGGQVLIGGVDVRQILKYSLRGIVGVVSQDHTLFDTTIAENIRLGSVGKTSLQSVGVHLVPQEEIEWAARQANAHFFISKLPQGYNTMVGSRGNQLSGGQKQRIAIARALIRDPKILLLDEATSALDTESERIVQDALYNARQGRTTIIIAHRLSTVRHADYIIAMEGGVVMEMGSHDQLLRQRGVYYNLMNAQLTSEERANDNNIEITSLTSPLFTPALMEQNVDKPVEWNDAQPNVSWFHVLRLSFSEWPILLVGLLAAGIQGAIFPSFAIFFSQALEVFTYPFNEVFELIHMWAWLFIVLGFVSAVATVFKIASISLAGEQLTYRLRCHAMNNVLHHSLSWFDKQSTSIAGILASDPPLVQGVIMALSSLTEVGVGLIVAMVIAMVSSWTLAVVIVGFIPLLVIAGLIQVWLLNRRGSSHSPSTQILMESVNHIRNVHLYNLQEIFYYNHKYSLQLPLKVELGEPFGLGSVYGFTNFILLIAYAVTFRFAAYLLTLHVDHTLYAKFDDVFTVFLAIIFGSLAAGQSSVSLPLATKAKSAANRILGVMATHIGDEEPAVGKTVDCVKGVLKLENIIFSFPTRPTIPVLNELSVTMTAGECLALVGPSGAGKSTVLSLIERLYTSPYGRMLVDDIDITSLELGWWRRQLGWVPQDVILFNRTIAENIAYGCHDNVTITDIKKAATTANIASFIDSLPMGYNTMVGSRGNQLSGGQKQRIAIARALIRDPKILLLDEATSALDTESERIVQDALYNARQGRTTIIIAHRLATVAMADQIAVLRAGHIVEEGTHSQLLQQQGLYYRLANIKHYHHGNQLQESSF